MLIWSQSGRSSGVEHNLAKVRVGRSIRLARSNFSKKNNSLQRHIFLAAIGILAGEAGGKQMVQTQRWTMAFLN
jgi:hypothetical protein